MTPLEHVFATQASLMAGRSVLTVVDAGAYVGDTPLRYAALFPDATVHAIEPDPANFADLERFTAGVPQVRRHRLALTDRAGSATLHRTGYAPTHSLLRRPAAGRRYYPADAGPAGSVEVAAVTLDQFCDEHRIAEIDVLKLDVQGSELAALRGAAGLLAAGRVSVVVAEVAFVPHYQGQPMAWHVCQLLDAHSYSPFDLRPDLYADDGQLRYADAVFVSPALRRSRDAALLQSPPR